MTGRRGAVVHALGAIDIALWDICGKAAGKPTWQLLGDARRARASARTPRCCRAIDDWDDLHRSFVDQVAWAQGLGFRAAKLELLITGPYAHEGLDERDERMVETIRAVREAAGPGLHDHGRRRLRLGRRRSRARRDRDLGRLRRVLRRDAALDRRPRGLRRARRALADPHRGGRVAGDALRVPRPHGPRRHPRRAARRRPRRRADRGPPRLRPRGRARSAGRPARLEDRHHDRGDGAARGDHAAHAVLRVRAAGGRREPRCAAS